MVEKFKKETTGPTAGDNDITDKTYSSVMEAKTKFAPSNKAVDPVKAIGKSQNKKVVIYTCLTGGYDQLLTPTVVDERFDYVYFAPKKIPGISALWTYRHLDFANLNKIELSRIYKIKPHLILNDYDYCVYMDANLQITDHSIYDQIDSFIKDETLWTAMKHPARDCLYQEGFAVVVSRKANYFRVKSFLHKLKSKGFPAHYGMTENGFILRDLRSPLVKTICDEWWNLFIESRTGRDQLCLPYVFWKNNFQPALFKESKQQWVYPGLGRYEHSCNVNGSYLMRTKRSILKWVLYYFNKLCFIIFGPISK